MRDSCGSAAAGLGVSIVVSVPLILFVRFLTGEVLDFALPEPVATLACHSDALFAVGGVRYICVCSALAPIDAQMPQMAASLANS